ncbi:uncharacterized protein LOC114334492 [Diabrotica virgifera virgifera]|uniref:DDE Tnp4 domain-containing protein n=1 Tax=Diabrotica virgifera virgifera TaxID=50390 RepID=A0ABM5IS56_DIAVI|nr:uncharacterized protein LOC114334492 [Diabrotica virgifera virgifera]
MMEEDLLTATACFLILCGDSRKRKRKCWVRPSLKKREKYGGKEILSDLKKDDVLLELRTDGCFKNFLRMSSSDMEFLLQKIAPVIRKPDTNCRKAIPPQERLAVTLRFLATGDSYSSLMYLFKISKQAISKIVPEVCAALVNAIKDQVKMPKTAQEWETITNGFSVLWNFPKCVGVMDGKNIAIQAPKNSGSDFFNYKTFFSIVLFGVMDANYRFLYFHVGSQGRISDGGVFENTLFKKLLTRCKLNLPEYSSLPGREKLVPHVFLGDDAFPLSPNLLKPYPGAQDKGSPKRIFNYRLSRARRISENVFGMLSSIFRIFRKPLLLEPETAEVVVMACIYLHNF